MSFGAPALLALLALAPLTAAGLLAVRGWRTRAAARYAGSQPPGALTPLADRTRWLLGAALLTAAVALVALAAARPQAGSREMQLERAGIDLMLVLDVSQSMDARDVAPSRLGRAQEEIVSLLDRLHGDRVGLVIFARSAVLRSPLSTDLRAVSQLVRSASRDQGLLRPGTALASAIDTAAEALATGPSVSMVNGTPAPGGSRVILVVSDGEDHEGGTVEAAARAAQEGILTYTAAVGGSEDAFIPELDPNGGQLRPKVDPATGQPITTRLNAGLLKRLVDIGGGRYVPLSPDGGRPAAGRTAGSTLASLANDFSNLERALLATQQESLPVERFQWFVLAALVALALEGAIATWQTMPRVRWASLMVPLALLGLVGAACATSAHSLNDEGSRLYAEGSYAEALDAYQRAQAERPDLGELTHNAANALHRLGRFERAAEEARRALTTDDPLLAARLYYGLGNHLFRLGRLEEAFNAYRSALIEDPSDADAKHNLEVVLRLLEQRPAPADTAGDGQGALAPLEGQPGEGAPARPGEGPTTEGPGQPADQEEGGRAERIQRDLQQALAGIEKEFTIEEALRVLDLIREQQELQPPPQERRPALGPDY